MTNFIFLCGAVVVMVPVYVLVMRAVKFGWKRLDKFTKENFQFSVDAGALRVTRPFSLAAQTVAVNLISSAELWFPLTRWQVQREVPAEEWSTAYVYYFLDDLTPRLAQRFKALLTLNTSMVSFWRRREAHRQDILSRSEVGVVVTGHDVMRDDVVEATWGMDQAQWDHEAAGTSR